MSKSNQVTGWYADMFKAWPAGAGSKPTAAQLSDVHALGLRPGKQAMANAMALRDSGTTGPQIVLVCGAPQLNRMRGLIEAGVIKRIAVSPNGQGHTVYKTEVTAKGAQVIKRAGDKVAAGDAKAKAPVKAKPASKPRKPATRKPAVPATPAPVMTADTSQPAGGQHDGQ